MLYVYLICNHWTYFPRPCMTKIIFLYHKLKNGYLIHILKRANGRGPRKIRHSDAALCFIDYNFMSFLFVCSKFICHSEYRGELPLTKVTLLIICSRYSLHQGSNVRPLAHFTEELHIIYTSRTNLILWFVAMVTITFH